MRTAKISLYRTTILLLFLLPEIITGVFEVHAQQQHSSPSLSPSAIGETSQGGQPYIHAYIRCRPRYFADDYKFNVTMSDKQVAANLKKMVQDTLDAFYNFAQVLDIMSTFGYEVVWQEKYKTMFESFITWATLHIVDTYSGRVYLFRKPVNPLKSAENSLPVRQAGKSQVPDNK
ncbi:MAG: hypothetical protein HYY40_07330 [Bacteroidetes bacterium]|nr:hypothetical protein [Bacteroidota bacterium]